ncbi:MAG: MBG domain-containing protein [Bacillota bacterium]|nr:MBG domain-containing protein [Bacillota bacterium]
MKKVLAVLIICIMCFCDVVPVMADSSTENTVTGDGEWKQDMPVGSILFITLADNPDLRWNANDSGDRNSVIHLDGMSGNNYTFKLYKIPKKEKNDKGEDIYVDDPDLEGYYGIKFIKDNGYDRFADIEGKSTDAGSVLHLYETDDKELIDNPHRHFAFYYQEKDDNGNDTYYIQNRNSGKWLGVEDSNKNGKTDAHDKIIQTTEDNRKLWIITNGVIPKTGDEYEDMIANSEGKSDKEEGAYIEIFKQGTIKSVNRADDHAVSGTRLHFHTMGTSCKWLIRWDETHAAYKIYAVSNGEKERNNQVWDVVSEDGSWVHLWKNQSNNTNENTSQFWRFIEQSDGSYKIQNARTGDYIEEENNVLDAVRLGTLKLTSKGDKLRIDAFAGTDDPVNFNYSADWMAGIPDDAYLSSVNIPGTHDTGTAAIVEDFMQEFSMTSCQKYYYGEQLNVGARSFDVRCNATKSGSDTKPKDVMIIHGGSVWQCINRDGQTSLTLDNILDDSVRFLKNHKTESIVMMLKPDAGSTEGLAYALNSFIQSNKDYVYMGNDIPSMGEARGKIVFIRRFAVDESKIKDTSGFGIDLSNWDDYSYHDYKYAVKIYNKYPVFVHVQDAFDKEALLKRDYIEGTLKQTVGEDTDPAHAILDYAWIYNYTSCAGAAGFLGLPLEESTLINPWLYDKKDEYFDNRRLGMVMLNFIDAQMSRLIYETNFAGGQFFVAKATAPTKVEITYGQTLDQATISGQTGNGTWSFNDGSHIPTYKEFKSGKNFTMTFTPNESGLKKVTAEVEITDFNKKPVDVTVNNETITYGDTPELTYTFNESNLVGDDTTDDLGITLEIGSPAYSSADKLKAGSYPIKAASSSNLYDVQFSDGTLTVEPETLGIQWSDTKNLIYTGNPVNVTANITGVLEGDDCKVQVTGGDEKGPSWKGTSEEPEQYTAKASISGADSANYKLPDSESSKDYYIRRNEPDTDDYKFPTAAVMTYGQKLSEATLVGASGEDEFIFWEVDSATGKITNINDTIPNAGEYEFKIAYKPENEELEHAATTSIKVTVLQKCVFAKAVAKSKVYGNNTPALTYKFDDSQLPECDKNKPEFDLGLRLTAGDGNDKFCDAGKYRIVKENCTNTNYDVTVIPAYLTVSKCVAEIKWPEQTEYTYNGAPVGVGAQITTLAKENDCEVVVLEGNHKDAGSYTARAVAFTNGNYVFAEDAERKFDYEIVKATPEVTFPKSAVITYGQTLNQAKLEGEDSDVAGEFVLEEPDKLLTVADSGYQANVSFVPDDTKNYNTVVATSKVKVIVNPKNLTVVANNQKKVYGQETPELTWYMDESQLVANDSIDEFRFILTAGSGDSKYCDVGGYRITLAESEGSVTKNDNYTIDFKKGTLQVDPLLAEIKWNPVHNITVGGAAPSAYVANLVTDGNGIKDDCEVDVESDGTDTSSWNDDGGLTAYIAKVTGLTGDDRFNYKLPDDDLEIQYYVRGENSTDVIMPETAIMTYGQKLSDAWMIGLSGPGSFTFVDADGKDIGETVPDAAETYSYKVKFTPEEVSPDYPEQIGDIKVTVRPKTITVSALYGKKTYGEETKLEFEVDESQLVLNDTKEDLKLTLTASDGEGDDGQDGDSINSPVGAYKIGKKECGNGNYNVTVMPAWYIISPKMISITWSDVSNLVYTGKPMNVTAQAQGLLEGDQCDVKVVGGDKIQPGTYLAVAVSLTNSNYKLPKEYNQLVQEYTIQEASDDNGGDSDRPGGDSDGSGGSGNGNADADVDGSVQTGDDSNVLLWAVVAMLALAGAGAVVFLGRRKK